MLKTKLIKASIRKIYEYVFKLNLSFIINGITNCITANKAIKIVLNKKNNFWLHDYALYRAIKDTFDGKSWLFWDKNIKFREKSTLAKYENELNFEINFHKYMQFQFFKQWLALKKYANENNIKIIGDIPIFVSLDSSDAWANPELFLFDKDRNPVKVAGVPPDYFSATGQLWGNPLYDWDYLEKTNFEWWIKRIQMNFRKKFTKICIAFCTIYNFS